MPLELLHFYLVCLVPALCLTLVYVFKRDRVMLKRCSTILLLMHVLIAILWLGPIACTIFSLLLCAVGVFEVLRQTSSRAVVIVVALLSTLAVFCLSTFDNELIMMCCLVLWIVVVLLTFIAPEAVVASRAWALVFAIVVVPAGSLALIMLIEPLPIVWMSLILLVQSNDTLSLLVGKRWGKRKIFPNLSPNKSLEGFLAGAAGVLLAMTLTYWIFPNFVTTRVLNITNLATVPAVVVLGVLLWLVCNVGDLLFSKLKRAQGIKDFSALLPGHGGVVDRFDSLLVLSPVAYVLLFAPLMIG